MFREKLQAELARGNNASIISIVNIIIWHGEDENASDIHIDPYETSIRVQFRIDGILQDIYTIPKNFHNEIISRIKILANLRTDEHQAAQDGRFRIIHKDNSKLDLRISIIPTYYGENAVLRLLKDIRENLSLNDLGISGDHRVRIENTLRKTSGMIAVTGPTGSGKTTTLYTLLKLLKNSNRSVITIEDPIEYAVSHVRQIQVRTKNGLTFANGLRSILRQDPDVVMVGEIRDSETANIAVNTALTGHLLLTTLHTNNAATAIPRLIDMNIEPFLIASTVEIIIGQRLIRKLCTKCKAPRTSAEEKKKIIDLITISELNITLEKSLLSPVGCLDCNKTGYKGRIGIYEFLVINTEIQDSIMQQKSASTINEIAKKNGMRTMAEDGLEKVASGITTFEEVMGALL